jgi:two-component system chemotaxis response regulator CheB
VALPEESTTPGAAIQELREQLLRTVKLYCPPHVAENKQQSKKSAPYPRARVFTDPFTRAPGRVDVVAIGASTGGPNALAQVLGALGPDFRAPVVIVQHIPPTFTQVLAKRLNAQCAIPVVEAHPGDTLTPGKAWLAPGDYHMAFTREGAAVQIRTHQEPHENSCRPSVDVLLRSAAETFAGNVLAVVLTGMGKDGLRGCELIREKGGQILVQDEASSVVWGMPGNVARAGLADQVLPLDQIGSEITQRVRPRTLSGSGIHPA